MTSGKHVKKSGFETLGPLMHPRSVAVIGASHDPKSVGYGVLKSLVVGSVFKGPVGTKGFRGKVYAVNPHVPRLLGQKCYPDITAVPGKVDLAVVCVPASIVPKVAKECGKLGVKAMVVVSAGFAEVGASGAKLQLQLLRECRRYGIRLLGPNCLGLIVPPLSLNASFALCTPASGPVAFVSQSGAIADSVIDWAVKEKYAFSCIVSTGNSADVDASQLLRWLGKDAQTKAIAMYIEGLPDGRKFIREAKRLRGKKPVLVIKGGRTAQGGAAAASHTGALAGDFKVFEGAMRSAGVTVAESIEELFNLARTRSNQPPLKRNAIAVVTNGGGVGVLCADYCSQYGLNLVPLKKSTVKELDATGLMHPAYSRKNPLDIIGDARPERYEAAINTLLSKPYIHGLVVAQTLQTMTDSVQDALAVVKASRKFPNKPIVCVFMGGKYSHAGVSILEKAGIPEFNDPRKAVQAMAALGSLL